MELRSLPESRHRPHRLERRSAQPPVRFEKSRSYQFRHHVHPAISFEKLRSPAVRFIFGWQRPDDPRVLIRDRHASLRRAEFHLLLCDPAVATVCFPARPKHHRARAMNEQHSQVRIAALV
jgi:hypothetical protein